MINKIVLICFIFILSMLSVQIVSFAQTNEDITITTYYPSPYGSYRELTSHRMKVGRTYHDSSVVVSDDNLIIEGNVGVGVVSPSSPAPNAATKGNLDVNDIYLRSVNRWLSQGAITCRANNALSYIVCGGTVAWRGCNQGDVMVAAEAIDNKYGRLGCIRCASLTCN